MQLWTALQTWTGKNAREKAASLQRDNVKKVAVIKHAALGDMLLVRPMLISLREAFPNATLTLSVVTNYMKGIPDDLVDRVHIARGNEKKYTFKETLQSYKELGEQDILFDISATTRSFWITKLTRAKFKIGFIHRTAHKFLYDVAIPRAHYRFEAETFMEQMHVLGVDFEWPLRFDMKKPPPVRSKPYILYFATSSVAYKCWPAENFARAIDRLSELLPQYEHILLAGLADWEKQVAADIAAKIRRENFLVLQGDENTTALVANASILVANDTSLRNMAIAFYTPSVGIFPASFTAFGYRPLFGPHRSVKATEDGPAPADNVIDAVIELEKSL